MPLQLCSNLIRLGGNNHPRTNLYLCLNLLVACHHTRLRPKDSEGTINCDDFGVPGVSLPSSCQFPRQHDLRDLSWKDQWLSCFKWQSCFNDSPILQSNQQFRHINSSLSVSAGEPMSTWAKQRSRPVSSRSSKRSCLSWSFVTCAAIKWPALAGDQRMADYIKIYEPIRTRHRLTRWSFKSCPPALSMYVILILRTKAWSSCKDHALFYMVVSGVSISLTF